MLCLVPLFSSLLPVTDLVCADTAADARVPRQPRPGVSTRSSAASYLVRFFRDEAPSMPYGKKISEVPCRSAFVLSGKHCSGADVCTCAPSCPLAVARTIRKLPAPGAAPFVHSVAVPDPHAVHDQHQRPPVARRRRGANESRPRHRWPPHQVVPHDAGLLRAGCAACSFSRREFMTPFLFVCVCACVCVCAFACACVCCVCVCRAWN